MRCATAKGRIMRTSKSASRWFASIRRKQLAKTVREVRPLYAKTSQRQAVELQRAFGGFVAKRNVLLGQRVGPGVALMGIVPLDQVWVDAIFKEPQLAGARSGQPVTLTADLYGRSVAYRGKVAGLGADEHLHSIIVANDAAAAPAAHAPRSTTQCPPLCASFVHH